MKLKIFTGNLLFAGQIHSAVGRESRTPEKAGSSMGYEVSGSMVVRKHSRVMAWRTMSRLPLPVALPVAWSPSTRCQDLRGPWFVLMYDSSVNTITYSPPSSSFRAR